MKIEYIENTVYDKTNNIYSFYLAREELLKDDTILLESDVIYRKEMITDLIASKDKNLAVVSQFESWMDGTCALLDGDCNIVGMVDKKVFNWHNTSQYYKTVNIYKFSKEFAENYYIPFLEAYQKAFGKNEYYEQVLKVLTFLGSDTLKAFVVPGDDWYEIDDPADLAIASDRFASGKQKLANFQHRFGGYWRFPKMLDFCYLVNPYFPPKQMVEEMKASFEVLMTQYPSGAAQQSLLAAKIWNILPEQVAVGNGAAELISSLGKMMTGKCAVPYPTFNEYPERFANMETVPVNTHEDFSYTADDILSVVKKENCNCVLLINPDNPSGNFLKKDEVEYLLSELKKLNATLIFDESFIDFAEKEVRYTLISSEMLEKHSNLIAVKSISKSYGIPGFRLGILASSNQDFVGKIKKTNAIWNINSFGEYFFQIYEKYSKTYMASCDAIAVERARFSSELSKIPVLKVYPSQSNFVMIRLNGKLTSTELTLKLLEEANIFIKDLSGKKCFENGGFIRLAVRNQEEDDRLLEALKTVLQ
ncbi:MAG: aminotransferase class I/II-fold pyridoxal phosphate-dependent enzyme [Treponema sp.]|uniref:aminotransferase class I/II-fold pyridoxal phosphate-dependent enzyme n=1 Tax=Treponema sp. TaxID=166 RepID=UPI00298E739C|nr:aminotransferase class I/II-fold pyridoxal phosphate-dependent enzyme [Treponema sp.]MCQ2601573.1 aminotransferase class I/II-fold pyridoxal phosphate-dependent enzyme [Treponema sp.]